MLCLEEGHQAVELANSGAERGGWRVDVVHEEGEEGRVQEEERLVCNRPHEGYQVHVWVEEREDASHGDQCRNLRAAHAVVALGRAHVPGPRRLCDQRIADQRSGGGDDQSEVNDDLSRLTDVPSARQADLIVLSPREAVDLTSVKGRCEGKV